MISRYHSKGLCPSFNTDEVPVVGAKALAGVKAINLKDDDTVQAVFVAKCSKFLLTQRGESQAVATADIPQAKQAGRGLKFFIDLRLNHIVSTAGPVFTENAGGRNRSS